MIGLMGLFNCFLWLIIFQGPEIVQQITIVSYRKGWLN